MSDSSVHRLWCSLLDVGDSREWRIAYHVDRAREKNRQKLIRSINREGSRNKRTLRDLLVNKEGQ